MLHISFSLPLPKIEEAVEETEKDTDESVSAESNDAENKKSSAVIPVAIGAAAAAAIFGFARYLGASPKK